MTGLVLRRAMVIAYLNLVLAVGAVVAQENPRGSVPQVVKFSGTIKNTQSTVGALFAVYKEQYGGVPLWQEIQNLQLDSSGRFAVLLGSVSGGLPAELFASGEPRWIGVQPIGGDEQPRVAFVSVPYALKAGDAETLGGLPASAFVQARAGSAAKQGTLFRDPDLRAFAQVNSDWNASTGVAMILNKPAIPYLSTQLLDAGDLPRISTANVFSGPQTVNAPVAVKGGLTADAVNGVFNPALCGLAKKPAWCAGSDMGAWINAAIAALPGGCGSIYVPAGNYTASTTVRRPKCVSISGAGAGATKILWNTTAGVASVEGDGVGGWESGGWNSIWLAGSGGDGLFLGTDPAGAVSAANTYLINAANVGLGLSGFDRAIRLGSNAWTWRCDHCKVHDNNVAIRVEDRIVSSGEMMSFSNSNIFNNRKRALENAWQQLPYVAWHFTNTSLDYNGDGIVPPIEGSAVFTASHIEQGKGPFFDTTRGGSIVDHGSNWILAGGTGTDACFGTIAQAVPSMFSGSQFMAGHQVSDLVCGSGDYQLFNIGLYGQARSTRGRTYFPGGSSSGSTSSTTRLSNGVAFDAVTFTVPPGGVVGGIVNYCVLVRNATDAQLACGQSTFTCVDAGSMVLGSATQGLQNQTATAGTEAIGVNINPGSGVCSWKIRSTSSLPSITSTELNIEVRQMVGGAAFTLH